MIARRAGLPGVTAVAATAIALTIGSSAPARAVTPDVDLQVESPQTDVASPVWAVPGTSLAIGTVGRDGFSAEAPGGVRFLAVALRVGASRPQVILTNAATPGDLLAALGVRLAPTDRVRPPRDEPLLQGERVRVTSPRSHPHSPGHGLVTRVATWYARMGMCAASGDLPLGAVVTVTDSRGTSSVTVIIDDRGPRAAPGRFLDLCQTAFAGIAPLTDGAARVLVGW